MVFLLPSPTPLPLPVWQKTIRNTYFFLRTPSLRWHVLKEKIFRVLKEEIMLLSLTSAFWWPTSPSFCLFSLFDFFRVFDFLSFCLTHLDLCVLAANLSFLSRAALDNLSSRARCSACLHFLAVTKLVEEIFFKQPFFDLL